MGFSRYYLKKYKFMFTKISGEVNDQNLEEHVIALNMETEGVSDLREIADCRSIENMSRLTVQGTVNCAQLENNRPKSLLALLVSDSSMLFGMARAYQTFSAGRRKSVEIFKDINKAIAWLANDDQEINIFNEFINMHNEIN